MNRLGAGAARRLDDRSDVEVTLTRRGGTDQHGFVGVRHVGGRGVRLGVHGHGGGTDVAASAHDTARDLSTIRDEDFPEH